MGPLGAQENRKLQVFLPGIQLGEADLKGDIQEEIQFGGVYSGEIRLFLHKPFVSIIAHTIEILRQEIFPRPMIKG
ncbi:hypothetical protein D3C86_2027090 [compost metagenome]